MLTMGDVALVGPAKFSVQELEQLLAAPKKTNFQSGNYPNTTANLFNGVSDSAGLRVP